MSIIYQKNHCILISHEKYLNSIYKNNVKSIDNNDDDDHDDQNTKNTNSNSTFIINPNLFAINSSFNRWNQQQQQQQQEEEEEEEKSVQVGEVVTINGSSAFIHNKPKRRKRRKRSNREGTFDNNNDNNDQMNNDLNVIERLKSDTKSFIEFLHNQEILQKKPPKNNKLNLINFYNTDAQSIRNLINNNNNNNNLPVHFKGGNSSEYSMEIKMIESSTTTINNNNNNLPVHFKGGNSSEYSMEIPIIKASTTTINNNNNNNATYFLIPPKCLFFNNNINQLENLLNNNVNANDNDDNKFDFIVLDPPWQNKFIKRARHSNKDYSYDMMTNEDILNIPLQKYLKLNSIIVIWCTNSPTHLKFIENQLINKWNLKLIIKWYWIKLGYVVTIQITNFGETICEFTVTATTTTTTTKKQPYEQLLILYPENSSMNINLLNEIKKEKFIYSVPSGIHSHKPPIHELFKNYLPEQPKCLELFARYLLPGFTSIGLEVLKLQNTKLFHHFD